MIALLGLAILFITFLVSSMQGSVLTTLVPGLTTIIEYQWLLYPLGFLFLVWGILGNFKWGLLASLIVFVIMGMMTLGWL